jgi:glycosyltransferase involved in cell wall biosynthesis
MIKRICHISSVHSRYDSRIFQKECIGLSQNGYQTFFIVADGKEDEIKEGVQILNVANNSKLKSRLKRIIYIPRLIEQKIIKMKPDLVHFHDPELIPLGLRLKRKGFIVIADFHEDIPLQILTKHYLNSILKRIVSFTFKIYQRYACRKLSAIVSATPTIQQTVIKYNARNVVVKNYPIIGEIKSKANQNNKWVSYIGGINVIRGFYEIIEAAKTSNIKLKLAGIFHEQELQEVIKRDEYSANVDFLGFLNKTEIEKLLSESFAGLVTLHPTPNFLDSLPIKLFEYMCAGIPVIASNFPLWKKIVEENECGICVDPTNPSQISDAIIFLKENPKEAKKMGDNGRKAVLEKYNWNNEEKKLIELYNTILS